MSTSSSIFSDKSALSRAARFLRRTTRVSLKLPPSNGRPSLPAKIAKQCSINENQDDKLSYEGSGIKEGSRGRGAKSAASCHSDSFNATMARSGNRCAISGKIKGEGIFFNLSRTLQRACMEFGMPFRPLKKEIGTKNERKGNLSHPNFPRMRDAHRCGCHEEHALRPEAGEGAETRPNGETPCSNCLALLIFTCQRWSCPLCKKLQFKVFGLYSEYGTLSKCHWSELKRSMQYWSHRYCQVHTRGCRFVRASEADNTFPI